MRTLLITIFLIISLGLIFIFTSKSSSQDNDSKPENIFPRTFQKKMICSESNFVHKDLEDRFQQKKVWWGLTSNSDLAELFVNLHTGRWSLIISNTDNVTCGLIGGEMSVPYDKNPYFK